MLVGDIPCLFSGQFIMLDAANSKAEKASIRKLLLSTISAALNRLSLSIGSQSISQLQIYSAFDGIFPKNITSKLQFQNNVDMATTPSPPTLSSSMVMQLLVDDLKMQYDYISEYVDIWRLVGAGISAYNAAMMSLSPTPLKAAVPSSIGATTSNVFRSCNQYRCRDCRSGDT